MSHGPECKGTYGVLCLNCGERVGDTGLEGPAKAIDLAAKVDRLARVVEALDIVFGGETRHPLFLSAEEGDIPNFNEAFPECDHCVDHLLELREAYLAYRKEHPKK